jgi:hypothetical protein
MARSDAFGDVRRDADVHHFQPSGELRAREDGVADLGVPERDGDRGADAGAANLAGVRVEAGGEVDRDHRPLQLVDELDDMSEEPLDLGGEAGAEDRVHPDGNVAHFALVPRKSGLIRHLDHGHGERRQKLQVGGGVAQYAVGGAEQVDAHGVAGLRQAARHHKAVTAVVAAAGGYADAVAGGLPEMRQEHPDGLAPGVFHQHPPRQAKRLDRQAVQRLHLGRGH